MCVTTRKREPSESFMIYVGFSRLKSGFELFIFNEPATIVDLILIHFVLMSVSIQRLI